MTESTPIRGRPRSKTSQLLILDAAYAILAERGYAGMSFEAVAESAGVGKTTIYRWWNGKADLAVSAFFHATQDDLAFPNTGKAREDFRLQITQLAKLLRGSRGTVLAAMLGGALTDPELSRSLSERWLNPRRKWGVERMMKAINAKECQPNIDPQAALSLLYAPLYTPLLFGQGVPSPEQVNAYLAIALPSIFCDNK